MRNLFILIIIFFIVNASHIGIYDVIALAPPSLLDRIENETVVKTQVRSKLTKAYSPDILYSGTLGPCFAIGIYDPNSRSGYMLHDPTFSQWERFEDQLEEIKRDYSNTSALQIVITGCSKYKIFKDDR